MKKLSIILSVLLVIDVLACRFNVRDVGFVDLGSEKYRLFISSPMARPPLKWMRSSPSPTQPISNPM